MNVSMLALSLHARLLVCVCVNISMNVGVCFHVFFSMWKYYVC